MTGCAAAGHYTNGGEICRAAASNAHDFLTARQ
jgi:hypothetical protein